MKGRIVRPVKDDGINLPRIGHIKTGLKDSRGYPVSLDYFIATGQYKRYFDESYTKPGTIQIVFFDDDPAISCNEYYLLIDKDGKRFGYGDGHDFEIWNGKEYQPLSLDEYPSLMDQTAKRANSLKGWEVLLTLKFVIPKIPKIFGYWEYSTKGNASTIPNIRKTFDTLLIQRSSVMGMVFDLTVSFSKSFKPGKANRYPVVNLIPNHSDDNLQMIKESLVFQNKALN